MRCHGEERVKSVLWEFSSFFMFRFILNCFPFFFFGLAMMKKDDRRL